MEAIILYDTGAAVEDIQRKLVSLGYLFDDDITGTYDERTASAVRSFASASGLSETSEVDEQVWARLVDATYELGDRVLYLRVPYFHGHDVALLQKALSALGFSCGECDGIFGVHTEDALRKFQLNMGLPSDGIAGAFTFREITNLQHSWKDKDSFSPIPHLGFARASEVLEKNLLCLFGTSQFTRSVAARMSNLAMATNPTSQVTSADSLLVSPDEAMMFVQILSADETPIDQIPVVEFEPENSLSLRLSQALRVAQRSSERVAIRIPSDTWEDAGEARSAQHYAIVLLDALCTALVSLSE